MNKSFRSVVMYLRPLLRFLLSVFFERRYLTGRHFDNGISGYLWAVRAAWTKNILRLGTPVPWPTGLTCLISRPENIEFHPDDLNNFQSPGLYLQNFAAKIRIGRGTYIAPNVGIITANHQLLDLDAHEPGRDVVIGEKCWIGMGAVLLPGVTLGPGTIVAAGAVVSTSFEGGRVVIGGVPAKLIKNLSGSDSPPVSSTQADSI